jgi:hypothetical protein
MMILCLGAGMMDIESQYLVQAEEGESLFLNDYGRKPHSLNLISNYLFGTPRTLG